ncbi:MAG: CBU_0592 family membrane protein [Lewinella sp.]|uniref:CBU_0592 family membrane protein n=1 Tax=Lewinella sp. TaxID=2004506 RepID=UPI003D6BBDA7
MEILIETFGWLGSALLILAYLLNSFNYLAAQSLWYQAMNFAGGGLLIINTIFLGAYPSSALNIVWVIIAGVNMLQASRKEKGANALEIVKS